MIFDIIKLYKLIINKFLLYITINYYYQNINFGMSNWFLSPS